MPQKKHRHSHALTALGCFAMVLYWRVIWPCWERISHSSVQHVERRSNCKFSLLFTRGFMELLRRVLLVGYAAFYAQTENLLGVTNVATVCYAPSVDANLSRIRRWRVILKCTLNLYFVMYADSLPRYAVNLLFTLSVMNVALSFAPFADCLFS